MSVLLGQSYYLLNDYKNAAATMMGVVNNAEKARPHAGGELAADRAELAVQARQQGRHRARRSRRWSATTRRPSTGRTCSTSIAARTRSDRVTLGFYRLMNDVGVLKQKGDYVEMAQLAIDAGVPGRSAADRREGRAERHAEERRQDRRRVAMTACSPAPRSRPTATRRRSRSWRRKRRRRRRARPTSRSVRPTSATACTTKRSAPCSGASRRAA